MQVGINIIHISTEENKAFEWEEITVTSAEFLNLKTHSPNHSLNC